MSFFRFWFSNSRPHALLQSVLPSLFAVCLAAQQAGFSLPLAILAVMGVIAGQMSANLFDDYFDYRAHHAHFRNVLNREGFRARIGKCVYLTSGQTTVGQLFRVSLALMGVAFFIGGIIFYFRGSVILVIAAMTAVLAISYSGPPLRLSYHGLGELVIGVIFGPLNMIGTYYAACGTLDAAIVFISVPIGLLVMNIIYVHSMLDAVADKKTGKHTLAVFLERPPTMLAVLFFILFLPFFIIAYGIWQGSLSVSHVALILTLPMAVGLFRMMTVFYKNPEQKFEPKPWMGFMRRWPQVEAIGIGWFMIRWFLARNLLVSVCVIGIILSFIR
ncbi:MAG: prenyltransferase [Azoarcus sp.]|jgi:1,4-dihydroxy-2-naphthoate octaprenyltransferase|nr:prenyltransferase [Azoarcus sp.]